MIYVFDKQEAKMYIKHENINNWQSKLSRLAELTKTSETKNIQPKI